MASIFIAGTGTEVGKTFVSSLLLRILGKKYRTFYFKPIETGGEVPEDWSLCSKIAHKSNPPLYHFHTPVSPHLAAKMEKKKINIEKVKKEVEKIKEREEIVLIEGAGGILVPLTENPLFTWADLIKELKIPTLIVASSYLGVINHTLCTIDVLERRGIDIVGVILNHTKPPENIAEKTNAKVLKKILGSLYLGQVRYLEKKGKNRLKPQDFDRVSHNILVQKLLEKIMMTKSV